MTHKLFEYYRKELQYLYEAGKEFAADHESAAGLLDLNASPDEDPFVRRLVESFAFINARTQLKLDEDFPQLATAMLDTLMPLWNRPIPAFGVVELEVEAQVAGKPGGEFLPRHETQIEIPSMPGVVFRTCYDTDCCAVDLKECLLRRNFPDAKHASAEKAVSIMKLSLEGQGGLPLNGLIKNKVRFYIEPQDYQYEIHEFLLNPKNLLGISANFDEQAHELPISNLRCVGFEADEMILDSPKNLPLEYQLVMEVFAYPGKHMFFDLMLPEGLASTETSKIDFFFFFDSARERLESRIDQSTFRLNCTPVVNLFPTGPVAVEVDRYCVDTLLDANQIDSDYEIYSLDNISGMDRTSGALNPIQPVYSVKHSERDNPDFYHMTRRPRSRKDGSDVFVSVVDLDLDPYVEFGYSQIEFNATCCNRRFVDLKNADNNSQKMKVVSEGLISRANLVSNWQRLHMPPFDSKVMWSLVSLLNLNYLIFHENHATDSLKQVLSLMNRTDAPLVEEWIKIISSVSTDRIVDRIEDGPWAAIAKGLKITVEFDATRDNNPGSWYLFAMAIDHFAALHASINSFTQTEIRASDGNNTLIEFAKKCGKKKLV